MKFGKLDFDPAVNPGVLDTATWAPDTAWRFLREINYDWLAVRQAALDQRDLPAHHQCCLYRGSAAVQENSVFILARLADGQKLFVEIGRRHSSRPLGKPLGEKKLLRAQSLNGYPADAPTIDRFCRLICPLKGPRRLGTVPRLGTGTRMTTAVWPGIFKAMDNLGFAANTIQNSVRELNLLGNLIEGRPAEKNYACGFGSIETGYTGSTWEGLWVSGALAALQHERPLRCGADADHIQVKRGPEGMARAKRLISAARYYSFYTLDMADVLDYRALGESSARRAEAYLSAKIPVARDRQAVIKYHREPFRLGRKSYSLDTASVGRFVGKYWDCLELLRNLTDHIASLKTNREFDLELTIDEHPPEINAFDCLTSDEEALFLLREFQRREIPVTHLAPNFGVEKGVDYRCPDGLGGLETRIRSQCQIARKFGVMLDFHSGDDLTSAPRRVIKRATNGWHHFKISPMLQIIYAGVLQEWHPDLFLRWWNDAFAYARREAEHGSAFAAHCLKKSQARKNRRAAWKDPVFHHYSFAFPGRRDAKGQFIHRHEFYSVAPGFYRAYQERISGYLSELAQELFHF
jgi:hypothetical protein